MAIPSLNSRSDSGVNSSPASISAGARHASSTLERPRNVRAAESPNAVVPSRRIAPTGYWTEMMRIPSGPALTVPAYRPGRTTIIPGRRRYDPARSCSSPTPEMVTKHSVPSPLTMSMRSRGSTRCSVNRTPFVATAVVPRSIIDDVCVKPSCHPERRRCHPERQRGTCRTVLGGRSRATHTRSLVAVLLGMTELRLGMTIRSRCQSRRSSVQKRRLANVRQPQRQHHHPRQPQPKPPMRRAAVAEEVEVVRHRFPKPRRLRLTSERREPMLALRTSCDLDPLPHEIEALRHGRVLVVPHVIE